MKILIRVLLLSFIIGPAGNALAKMDAPALWISPCGSSTGICGHGLDGADPGDAEDASSGGCETTSFGTSQCGGTTTVCVQADGSSSWYEAEWCSGYFYEDSGSVTMQGGTKFNSSTSSSDFSDYAR